MIQQPQLSPLLLYPFILNMTRPTLRKIFQSTVQCTKVHFDVFSSKQHFLTNFTDWMGWNAEMLQFMISKLYIILTLRFFCLNLLIAGSVILENCDWILTVRDLIKTHLCAVQCARTEAGSDDNSFWQGPVLTRKMP